MKTSFNHKTLSESVRRRVDLAVAVAQERLLTTHTEHALRLLELIGQHIPFDEGLSIYTRLLRLSEEETRAITSRSLAILGERAASGDSWRDLALEYEPEPVEVTPGPLGFIQNVRQRVRGRVNDELRRWIEVSAAATEVAVLGTHVQNALNFVKVLDKEVQFTDAIELYLDHLSVRDSIAEVTYYTAVANLKDRVLPKPAKLESEATGPARLAMASGDDRVLRVVETDGGGS